MGGVIPCVILNEYFTRSGVSCHALFFIVRHGRKFDQPRMYVGVCAAASHGEASVRGSHVTALTDPHGHGLLLAGHRHLDLDFAPLCLDR